MKKLILIFLASVAFFACSKKDSPIKPDPPKPPVVNIFNPPAFGFYVIGYFPSYRTVAEYPDRFFKMCNLINYAFAAVNAAGTITVSNTTKFDSVYTKAKANGAKVFLSVNGTHADFKTATDANKILLIKDIMSKVRTLRLDGVDIDWEYPTTNDGTDAIFASFMKQLSDSLHVEGKYYLSAAITPGRYAGSIRDGIRNEIFSYVDFFNVMTYDDFSTTTPYRHHSNFELVQYCIDYWINTRRMPKEKFVLGLPGYGRPSGITQTNTVLSYKSILSQGGSSLLDSAVVSAGGFTNYTIYYNGQPTIKRKTILAKQAANGVMFWEIGQDATNDFSLIKAACDTIGRAY